MFVTSEEAVWGRPKPWTHRLAIFAAVAVAAVVAVLALVALQVIRSIAPPSSHGFNHAVWVAHHGPREGMLADLLTNKICPATSYRRVLALLGPPDSTLTYPKGSAPSIEYDVGSFGLFHVDFKKTPSGYAVYTVSPPPSSDGWPDRGCWA